MTGPASMGCLAYLDRERGDAISTCQFAVLCGKNAYETVDQKILERVINNHDDRDDEGSPVELVRHHFP
jgi:hypothetical protein